MATAGDDLRFSVLATDDATPVLRAVEQSLRRVEMAAVQTSRKVVTSSREMSGAFQRLQTVTQGLVAATSVASGGYGALIGLWLATRAPMVGLIAGLGAVSFATLKAASAWELGTAALENMNGSLELAQQQILRLADFAAETPFEFQNILRANNQLRAFGFTAEESLQVLERVGNTVAAFGDFSQQKIDQVVLALGRLKGGGRSVGETFETLRRFGISQNQLEQFGVEFSKGGKLLSSTDRVIEAVLRVMDQKFTGMMKKLNDTISGQVSNMKDLFFQFFAELGGPGAEKFKNALKFVNSLLERLVKTVREFRQSAGMQRLSESFERIGNAFRLLGTALTPATNLFRRFFRVLASVPLVLYVALLESLAWIVRRVAFAVDAAIGSIRNLASAVRGALGPLKSLWDVFRNIWQAIKNADFGNIASIFKEGLTDLPALIGAWFEENGPTITQEVLNWLASDEWSGKITGAITGGIIGLLVGGPAGALLGAALGAWIGHGFDNFKFIEGNPAEDQQFLDNVLNPISLAIGFGLAGLLIGGPVVAILAAAFGAWIGLAILFAKDDIDSTVLLPIGTAIATALAAAFFGGSIGVVIVAAAFGVWLGYVITQALEQNWEQVLSPLVLAIGAGLAAILITGSLGTAIIAAAFGYWIGRSIEMFLEGDIESLVSPVSVALATAFVFAITGANPVALAAVAIGGWIANAIFGLTQGEGDMKSLITPLVTGIVGGLIGFLIGGPAGAALGAGIGLWVGNGLDVVLTSLGITNDVKLTLGGGIVGALIGFFIGGPAGAALGLAFGTLIGNGIENVTTGGGWTSLIGTLAGAIIGGIVGFMVGGPAGALVGAALGGMLGAAVQSAISSEEFQSGLSGIVQGVKDAFTGPPMEDGKFVPLPRMIQEAKEPTVLAAQDLAASTAQALREAQLETEFANWGAAAESWPGDAVAEFDSSYGGYATRLEELLANSTVFVKEKFANWTKDLEVWPTEGEEGSLSAFEVTRQKLLEKMAEATGQFKDETGKWGKSLTESFEEERAATVASLKSTQDVLFPMIEHMTMRIAEVRRRAQELADFQRRVSGDNPGGGGGGRDYSGTSTDELKNLAKHGGTKEEQDEAKRVLKERGEVIPQAMGGIHKVTRPTLFLAGEAGPEIAAFAPTTGGAQLASPMGAGGTQIGKIEINVTEAQDAKATAQEVSRIIARNLGTQRHLLFASHR